MSADAQLFALAEKYEALRAEKLRERAALPWFARKKRRALTSRAEYLRATAIVLIEHSTQAVAGKISEKDAQRTAQVAAETYLKDSRRCS